MSTNDFILKIISIHWLKLSLQHFSVSKVGLCETLFYQRLNLSKRERRKHQERAREEVSGKAGVGGGRGGFCEAERQHGGDTSVAVLTFSPLEPGCQHKPLGPDSSQTPELRWRNKGCFPLSSLFPSAAVFSFRKECKIPQNIHYI